MERTAFTVDNVSETSSNTRETQCSGSTAVRHVCAPSVCSVIQRRGSALQRGVPGEPCEGEPVRRHPHPGAVRVSETPRKNAVPSISLLLDANPCSQRAQPQGTERSPAPAPWWGPEAQARVFPGGGSSRTARLSLLVLACGRVTPRKSP